MSSWPARRYHCRGADEGKVGTQGFAHFGHVGFQPCGQGLAFGDLLWRVTKYCGEDVHNPGPLLAGGGRVVLPFLVGSAQRLGLGGITGFQPLREDPQQHRQGNEGAGDLDEGKPVGVMTGDVAGSSRASRDFEHRFARDQPGDGHRKQAGAGVGEARADVGRTRARFPPGFP